MGEPEPVDSALAKQLYLAGRIIGMIAGGDDPMAIREVVKELDPYLLQAYLDTKPEGFLYGDKCAEVIRLAKTLKSFSKE
jgi:hypothetical protein